jgi:tRNA(Ile)-lysidine synthase
MATLESRLLSALAPFRAAPAWRVALSGGLDSSVLLHLLARLAQREALPSLSAVHVHHGLQEAADAWPAHCQSYCDELGVPLRVCHVLVAAGPSIERAAREARYAAFERMLEPDECLLTGQHRDDQAETLLFRLLRGAGVHGLGGMPNQRRLGAGVLVRPLLNASRVELESYARQHGLVWVEDPSNADTRHARNYLRREVLPLLQRHWPQAAASIVRSAGHMREAQQLLDELAIQDLSAASAMADPAWLPLPSLDLAALKALSRARQRNALRRWLAVHTRMPDSDHWAGWEDLRDAAPDASPIWRLADGELHRAEGRIWWLSGDWLRTPEPPAQTFEDASVMELSNNGRLQANAAALSSGMQVHYRQGGEVLDIPGRGRRDLKRLLNEAGVPSFVRARLPLLYRDGRLVAVANMPAWNASEAAGWELVWEPPASDPGLS